MQSPHTRPIALKPSDASRGLVLADAGILPLQIRQSLIKAEANTSVGSGPPLRKSSTDLKVENSKTSGLSLTFPPPATTAPPVHFPTTPHRGKVKIISDQRVKPCWKNRPTLKL